MFHWVLWSLRPRPQPGEGNAEFKADNAGYRSWPAGAGAQYGQRMFSSAWSMNSSGK